MSVIHIGPFGPTPLKLARLSITWREAKRGRKRRGPQIHDSEFIPTSERNRWRSLRGRGFVDVVKDPYARKREIAHLALAITMANKRGKKP